MHEHLSASSSSTCRGGVGHRKRDWIFYCYFPDFYSSFHNTTPVSIRKKAGVVPTIFRRRATEWIVPANHDVPHAPRLHALPLAQRRPQRPVLHVSTSDSLPLPRTGLRQSARSGLRRSTGHVRNGSSGRLLLERCGLQARTSSRAPGTGLACRRRACASACGCGGMGGGVSSFALEHFVLYTGLREKGAGPWRGWGPRPLTGLDCGKRLGTAVPGLCRSVRRFAFFVRELYVGGCEEPF
jgi:hypothetical protein